MTTAAEVWRDFVTNGVPSSGANNPAKADVRAWGGGLETLINAVSNGGKIYATKAAMDADGTPAINTAAIIVTDATPANNGLYQKTAAAPTATWVKRSDFVPGFQFIAATDAGAGTANAIVATSSLPIPTTAGVVLVSLNIFEANTGFPVTVAFNGGTPLTIKTNGGADVAVGGLTAGAIVVGVVGSGNTFRLLSDQASAAFLAACEAAAVAAAASATTATAQAVIAGAAAIANGAYVNTYAAALPRGVTGVTSLVGGSGGTNGTFALGVSGGSISNVAGTFTVSGGAVTAVNFPVAAGSDGRGLGSGTTPPTLSFSASAGLTGASATAVVAPLVATGNTYWALSADGLSLAQYRNDGTSTPAATGVTLATANGLADVAVPKITLEVDDFPYSESGSDNNMLWGVHNYHGPIGPFTPLAIRPPRYTRDATTHLFAPGTTEDIVLFPYISMSWFIGAATAYSVPITDAAVDGDYARMLSSGIWPDGRMNTGLVQAYSIPYSTSIQDTGVPFMKALNAKLYAALGVKRRLVVTGAGLSGALYSQVKRGTAVWNELLRVIREVRDFARAEGRRVVIPGVLMTLGAADATTAPGMSAETVRRQLMQLRNDLQKDITEICPQTAPIQLFPWVPNPSVASGQNWPEVALGYAQAVTLPNIHPVGPTYQLGRALADKLHLDALGQCHAGQMFAEVVANKCFGLDQSGPLYVIDAWRSGAATFDVRFSVPVTIDNSGTVVNTNALTTAKGFYSSGPSQAAPTSSGISSVAAVTGPNSSLADTLRVTMSGTPSTGRFSLGLGLIIDGSDTTLWGGPRTLICSAASFQASLFGGADQRHWAMCWKGDFQI